MTSICTICARAPLALARTCDLRGKTLIGWTIEQALQPSIDAVYVSTDDDEIADVASTFGALVPYYARLTQQPSAAKLPVIEDLITSLEAVVSRSTASSISIRIPLARSATSRRPRPPPTTSTRSSPATPPTRTPTSTWWSRSSMGRTTVVPSSAVSPVSAEVFAMNASIYVCIAPRSPRASGTAYCALQYDAAGTVHRHRGELDFRIVLAGRTRRSMMTASHTVMLTGGGGIIGRHDRRARRSRLSRRRRRPGHGTRLGRHQVGEMRHGRTCDITDRTLPTASCRGGTDLGLVDALICNATKSENFFAPYPEFLWRTGTRSCNEPDRPDAVRAGLR